MELHSEHFRELTEVIEDTVSYCCDKHQISGQLAWITVESLATAKLREFQEV